MLLHLVKGLIYRQNCILYSALHFLRQKLDWQSIPQGHEIPTKIEYTFKDMKYTNRPCAPLLMILKQD